MGLAKVTRNYQVTIPRDVRELRDIAIGDTVLFTVEGDNVNFKKIEKKRLLKEIAGSWSVKGSSVDYVKNIRSDWKKRRGRLGL